MASEHTPSSLPPPGDPDAVYILDVSGYVFRAYHALPTLTTRSGEPTHAVLGLTNMVLRLIEDQKPARICVCYDPKGPSFRKTMYEHYKANRQAAPADLKAQLARCEQVIDALHLKSFRDEALEADDLIATVVARAREARLKPVIVSADKDLLQLVDEQVVMWDSMRHLVLGPEETKQKLGVLPRQVGDFLALTGDSSDNIPGVPSVGPKTAQQLLQQYGSLDGIYEAVDRIAKPSLKKRLLEHRHDATLSRALVALRTDPALEVDFDGMTWDGGDGARLTALFEVLEFGRLRGLVASGQLGGGVNGAATAVLPRGESNAGALREDRASELAAVRTVRSDADAEALRRRLEAGGEAGIYIAALPSLAPEGFTREGLVGIAVAFRGEAWFLPEGLLQQWLAAPASDVPGALGRPRFAALDLKRESLALRSAGLAISHGFDVGVAAYLLAAGERVQTAAEYAEGRWGRLLTEEKSVFGSAAARALRRSKQEGLLEEAKAPALDQAALAAFSAERALLALQLAEDLRGELAHDGQGALYDEVELPLVSVLVELEGWGIRIDKNKLGAMAYAAAERLAILERKAHTLAGKTFNLASPKQLEVLFFDELGLPVVKKTSKGGRSTDVEVLEELSSAHALPALILEHRRLAKLKGTYLDALPRAVRQSTGRVHTVFHQTVAATGRLSSSDPNLQNIPIRTELGREIREAFVPEDGWALLSADYSQIELRVLAHLSKDPELCSAFLNDADVHRMTASALFSVAPEETTKEQRGQAKTVNYAVIYGQSPFALAKNLAIPRREAVRYIDAFFERYAGVRRFLDTVVQDAKETGEVRTLLGRRRKIPDLHSRRKPLQQAAERIAQNTPIQGSAADIIKIAMVAVSRGMKAQHMAARMLLTVHDELVFEAPREEREMLEALVRNCMEQAYALGVPLKVDTGWGPTWGAAH